MPGLPEVRRTVPACAPNPCDPSISRFWRLLVKHKKKLTSTYNTDRTVPAQLRTNVPRYVIDQDALASRHGRLPHAFLMTVDTDPFGTVVALAPLVRADFYARLPRGLFQHGYRAGRRLLTNSAGETA